MRGNFTQLQEVMFNIIDNAYDAMMQRKVELKEPDYHPTIRISASGGDNGHLTVIVADNGIGIQEQDKEKIFTPFFTTKLSSKKGTGLGLYYIDAFHQEENEPMPMLKLSKSVYEKLLLIRESKMDDAIYHMLDCIHKTDDNLETYYIDYFNFYFDKKLGLHDNNYFEILRNTITTNLEKKNIDKVQAKYLWMKDNFNNCLYVKAGLIEKIEIN